MGWGAGGGWGCLVWNRIVPCVGKSTSHAVRETFLAGRDPVYQKIEVAFLPLVQFPTDLTHCIANGATDEISEEHATFVSALRYGQCFHSTFVKLVQLFFCIVCRKFPFILNLVSLCLPNLLSCPWAFIETLLFCVLAGEMRSFSGCYVVLLIQAW